MDFKLRWLEFGASYNCGTKLKLVYINIFICLFTESHIIANQLKKRLFISKYCQ